MAQSGTPGPDGSDQSLGDLVALAAKDVSQLVRYEIDLAKYELRGDVRRIGLAGALIGVAAFVGCLVLVLFCIAFAYGLITIGVWNWLAFLLVGVACILFAAIATLIAWLRLKGLSGMRKTRQSVQEGLGMLRHDGERPEIPGRQARPGDAVR
jgi:hypothetical protein